MTAARHWLWLAAGELIIERVTGQATYAQHSASHLQSSRHLHCSLLCFKASRGHEMAWQITLLTITRKVARRT
ncbi:unnamed protein product [Urochloa humidicola]